MLFIACEQYQTRLTLKYVLFNIFLPLPNTNIKYFSHICSVRHTIQYSKKAKRHRYFSTMITNSLHNNQRFSTMRMKQKKLKHQQQKNVQMVHKKINNH